MCFLLISVEKYKTTDDFNDSISITETEHKCPGKFNNDAKVNC